MSGTCCAGMLLVRIGAGSGRVVDPDGRRRITRPLRFSSTRYRSDETRRESSGWVTGRFRAAAKERKSKPSASFWARVLSAWP